MAVRISEMTAGTVAGEDLMEVSKLSASITITATTISAAAADNSLNHTEGGFITAGFTAGRAVKITGFTGDTGNNFFSARVQSVTAEKMVLSDDTVLTNDSAGESVTITQWLSRRTTAAEVGALGSSDADAITYTPADASDWTSSADPGSTADALDQLASRMAAAELESPVGTHMVPVMAVSMTPRQTGGCATLAYLSGASNQPDVPYLAFDSTTAEYAEFAIAMPESWNEGTLTFQPIWTHPATTTNFGVVWQLQAVAVSNDDALAVNFGTAQSSTDTGGTTNDHYIGPASAAITVAGTPQAGDTVFFRVSRLPTDGSDTMAVDAYLLGVRLYMTTAASVDA